MCSHLWYYFVLCGKGIEADTQGNDCRHSCDGKMLLKRAEWLSVDWVIHVIGILSYHCSQSDGKYHERKGVYDLYGVLGA